ncbi:MAG: HTTM domain-containing protein [Deltaproteobacteria bacterium]
MIDGGFTERLGMPGSARHLALVRIVFALHALSVLTTPAIPMLEELAVRPHQLTRTYVPRLVEAVAARHIEALVLAGVVLSLLAAVGLFTRVAVPLLLAVFVLTQNYWFRGSAFHDDWLYFMFDLLVLSLAPCADAWSVDCWLRRRRPSPDRPPNAHRWPVEMMIAWFAGIYVAAGIAKLFPLRKGLLWLSGASTQQLAWEFMHSSPIVWVHHRPLFDYSVRWPFQIASYATALVELGAAAIFVSRRAYTPVLASLMVLHAGIHAFGIPAFVRICLMSAVLLLPPEGFGDFDPSRAGNRG